MCAAASSDDHGDRRALLGSTPGDLPPAFEMTHDEMNNFEASAGGLFLAARGHRLDGARFEVEASSSPDDGEETSGEPEVSDNIAAGTMPEDREPSASSSAVERGTRRPAPPLEPSLAINEMDPNRDTGSVYDAAGTYVGYTLNDGTWHPQGWPLETSIPPFRRQVIGDDPIFGHDRWYEDRWGRWHLFDVPNLSAAESSMTRIGHQGRFIVIDSSRARGFARGEGEWFIIRMYDCALGEERHSDWYYTWARGHWWWLGESVPLGSISEQQTVGDGTPGIGS